MHAYTFRYILYYHYKQNVYMLAAARSACEIGYDDPDIVQAHR